MYLGPNHLLHKRWGILDYVCKGNKILCCLPVPLSAADPPLIFICVQIAAPCFPGIDTPYVTQRSQRSSDCSRETLPSIVHCQCHHTPFRVPRRARMRWELEIYHQWEGPRWRSRARACSSRALLSFMHLSPWIWIGSEKLASMLHARVLLLHHGLSHFAMHGHGIESVISLQAIGGRRWWPVLLIDTYYPTPRRHSRSKGMFVITTGEHW